MNPLDQLGEILKRVQKGDREAFAQLYTSLGDRVYNIALGYLQNPIEAEEVTQEVFVKIFRFAHNFSGDSSVATWVYRICINACKDNIEKRKRRIQPSREVFEDEITSFDDPSALMEKKERKQALLSAINLLADKQRTAIILSFVDDLPRKEVAEIMEFSLKAVESLLQRGKANLRKILQKFEATRRKK